LAILKADIQKVIDAETDSAQIDEYKKMMKDTFE
jgi:hypothetical protein